MCSSRMPPVFGRARGTSFGRPLNVGAPEFKLGTFTFTPPPNMPKFPMPQPQTAIPAQCSSPPLTNVDTGLMHTQQGHEKHQHLGSVDSVASETSDDGRGVMTSFKFSQESLCARSSRHHLHSNKGHQVLLHVLSHYQTWVALTLARSQNLRRTRRHIVDYL
jgi:hypothetical protein